LLHILLQRGTKSTPKGGVLDDLLHIDKGNNRLSIIAELGNQPTDVNVIANLICLWEPLRHLAQICLMTKTEMSHGQGSCGPMADSMSHHLPDLCQETSELIGNVCPHRQHHHNSGDCCVRKHRVTLTTRLRQGSGGTCLGGCIILLAGSLR
jgi:hypothetical protein